MRSKYLSEKVLDFLLISAIAYHLIISPYTKVEESFNIQAVHDMLNYGAFPQEIVRENYDHMEFPGVVPRTFIGSLFLSGVVKFFDILSSFFGKSLITNDGISQLDVQMLVRGILGLTNACSFIEIRNTVNRVCIDVGNFKARARIGFWFILLLLSQFHILYYSSRTLPNFIALPLTNHAISKILAGEMTGYAWLSFTAIVFRLEVGLFGVIISLVSSLIYLQSNFWHNTLMLVVGTVTGLIATGLIDSYFWGYWLIPELVSFKFNILFGKSTEWGVEPWSSYFLNYSQQLFKPATILLLFIPYGNYDPFNDGRKIPSNLKRSEHYLLKHPARYSIDILWVSSVLFVAGMSFQPHKEWRFVIYTIPVFLLKAATTLCDWSIKRSKKYIIYSTLLTFFFANLVLGTGLSILMGYVSSFNYPGGDAITSLNKFIHNKNFTEESLVHMDVASCMSGITRFTESHGDLVKYDKTEKELDLLKIWNDIDFRITENSLDSTLKLEGVKNDVVLHNEKHWRLIHKAEKFEAVTVLPIIFILQQQGKDSRYLINFAAKIVSEAVERRFDTITNLLNEMIVKTDYLYIYERVGSDDQVYQLIEDYATQDHPQDENLEPEDGLMEDVKLEDLGEDVNEEIDRIETLLG